MARQAKGSYTLKTYTPNLYIWKPDINITKKIKNPPPANYFCNATPNSQGEDWICNYVYNIIVVNGVQKRLAYVACDYVM